MCPQQHPPTIASNPQTRPRYLLTCIATHHPLAAPFDIPHIIFTQIFQALLTISLESFQQFQEMHAVIPHSTSLHRHIIC